MLPFMYINQKGEGNENIIDLDDIEYLWRQEQEKKEGTGVDGEESREVLKLYIIL